jgi:hypothetical protein
MGISFYTVIFPDNVAHSQGSIVTASIGESGEKILKLSFDGKGNQWGCCEKQDGTAVGWCKQLVYHLAEFFDLVSIDGKNVS